MARNEADCGPGSGGPGHVRREPFERVDFDPQPNALRIPLSPDQPVAANEPADSRPPSARQAITELMEAEEAIFIHGRSQEANARYAAARTAAIEAIWHRREPPAITPQVADLAWQAWCTHHSSRDPGAPDRLTHMEISIEVDPTLPAGTAYLTSGTGPRYPLHLSPPPSAPEEEV